MRITTMKRSYIFLSCLAIGFAIPLQPAAEIAQETSLPYCQTTRDCKLHYGYFGIAGLHIDNLHIVGLLGRRAARFGAPDQAMTWPSVKLGPEIAPAGTAD
jgi:hypothetical protein